MASLYLQLYIIFKDVKRKLKWLKYLVLRGAIAILLNKWTNIKLSVN
jgi:hypothetical protein